MMGRQTYLIVGLLVAGGAPYLSSRPEVQQRMGDWSAPTASDAIEAESVFQLASAKEADVVATSKNPFGGATTESVVATSQSGTASTSTAQTTSMPNGVNAAPASGSRGSARLVSTVPATAKSRLPPVDGSVPIRFEEVFRLDVNSAWLMARWPRVTTGLADLDLHGYRVPLVTGTREDDIAGALTYYYDQQQVIQKMTFRGMTGDPRRLVLFLTSQNGFEREYVPDPALQVYRAPSTGALMSELRVRPAAVIRADAPRERFELELVLAR